jgi:hypothetical protein
MSHKNWNRAAAVSAVLLVLASAPAVAGACCPSGGNGIASTSGLGESAPAAVDVSADPSWSVYEFTRSGVNYTQINDAGGGVRAAVGNIGSTAWVLPLGTNADRVLLPGDALPAGNRRTIFKSAKIEVVLIETTVGPYWLILPVETTTN